MEVVVSQILAQKRSDGDSVVHTPSIAFRDLRDVVNQCLEFECGVEQCPSVPVRWPRLADLPDINYHR